MSVRDNQKDPFMVGLITIGIVLVAFLVGMTACLLWQGPPPVEYQMPDGSTVMCDPSDRSCNGGGTDGS